MQNNRTIGSEYEDIIVNYIKEKGYEILVTNYRCKQGEIDIVAKDGKYLVFIEVKYRKSSKTGVPIEAVTLSKQKIISRVALYYLYDKHLSIDTPIRFDVAGVLDKEITYIENAFTYIRWTIYLQTKCSYIVDLE